MKIRQMDGKVVRQWWVICKPEPYEALVGEAGTDADFGGRSDEVCMDNFKNEGRYGNVGVERLRCGGMSNSNDISRLCTLLEDTVKAVDKFARLMFVTAEMSPVQCFAVVEQKKKDDDESFSLACDHLKFEVFPCIFLQFSPQDKQAQVFLEKMLDKGTMFYMHQSPSQLVVVLRRDQSKSDDITLSPFQSALARESTKEIQQFVPATLQYTEQWDHSRRWWSRLTVQDMDDLLDSVQDSIPLHVYHIPTLCERAQELKENLPNVSRLFFASKSNSHPILMKEIYKLGFGLECVSLQEVDHAMSSVGASADRILFTPNFATKSEYVTALNYGIQVTVDNLYCLKKWPDVFNSHSIALRIDPKKGRGHHQHVVTAGAQSKFGIALEDVPEIIDLSQKHNFQVVGLHCHSGSGIFDPSTWREHAEVLLSIAEKFSSIRFIDIGGGIGIPYKFKDKRLDLKAVNQQLSSLKHQDIELWMEPGRFLVAECGVLLSRVTQIKHKADVKFIGITAGMNNLIRPALYGSYHEIVNLSVYAKSRKEQTASAGSIAATDIAESPPLYYGKDCEQSTVCGSICESADIFARDCPLPRATMEGDVILLDTTGAYGASMESSYNLRPRAASLFLLHNS